MNIVKPISIFTVVLLAGLFSCTQPKDSGCIHCSGCFSSWDECPENYNSPVSWEEYRDSMINLQYSGTTIYCQPAD